MTCLWISYPSSWPIYQSYSPSTYISQNGFNLNKKKNRRASSLRRVVDEEWKQHTMEDREKGGGGIVFIACQGCLTPSRKGSGFQTPTSPQLPWASCLTLHPASPSINVHSRPGPQSDSSMSLDYHPTADLFPVAYSQHPRFLTCHRERVMGGWGRVSGAESPSLLREWRLSGLISRPKRFCLLAPPVFSFFGESASLLLRRVHFTSAEGSPRGPGFLHPSWPRPPSLNCGFGWSAGQ